ncbi:Uncharacterised protein [Bordetella pertussis]|nr:Uncharacterised protein [Bordetella pertussis]
MRCTSCAASRPSARPRRPPATRRCRPPPSGACWPNSIDKETT